MRTLSKVVLPGLLLMSTALPVSAQTPAPAASPASPPAAAPDYHPSMGDLMTMAVQPRHTKLYLAARRRNWAYTAYELAELRNALGRVGRTIPVYRSVDTAPLIEAITAAPLATLEQAIHAKDSAAFASAYAALTAACNACHQSQDHAMVVIRVPRGDAYPDQSFEP